MLLPAAAEARRPHCERRHARDRRRSASTSSTSTGCSVSSTPRASAPFAGFSRPTKWTMRLAARSPPNTSLPGSPQRRLPSRRWPAMRSRKRIGWREIEVVRGDHGPTLSLHGRASDRAAELGVTSIWVSLTHSGTTAGAVVVLEAARASNSVSRERLASVPRYPIISFGMRLRVVFAALTALIGFGARAVARGPGGAGKAAVEHRRRRGRGIRQGDRRRRSAHLAGRIRRGGLVSSGCQGSRRSTQRRTDRRGTGRARFADRGGGRQTAAARSRSAAPALQRRSRQRRRARSSVEGR